jgi:arylsulfatase A-like enzyme
MRRERRLLRRASLPVVGGGILALLLGAAVFGWIFLGDISSSLRAHLNRRYPHVIIVMVDTLRADHLGCYGYERDTSPNIDAFAERNLLFLRNVSQAACTYPSVNSILTSRYGSEFTMRSTQVSGIPDGMPYLPELLKRNGYYTVAVTTSGVFTKTPTRVNAVGGFGRGFDEFHEHLEEPAPRVLETLRQIDLDRGKPLFLYLHYMDPHYPYRPPVTEKRFTRDYEGYSFIRRGDPFPIQEMIYYDGPQIELGQRDIDHLVDLYDEEIAYFDAHFAELMDFFESRGLTQNGMVFLMADHGEEFLEHGHIQHCRTPFDTLIRTPLIVHLSGEGARGTRTRLSQNLQVVPTILDYLGIPPEGHGFAGSSLRPVIQSRREIEPFAYSAQGVFRSVTGSRYKLIYDMEQETAQLFDLAEDPGELRDLSGEKLEQYTLLMQKLGRWIRESGETDELIAAEKRIEENLEALGYLRRSDTDEE